MITVNNLPPDLNALRPEAMQDNKEESIPPLNGPDPERNTGTSGRGRHYIRQYKISKLDAAPAAESLALSFAGIQRMLAGSSQFQHLALREVDRDGNCFFHALADVINHNDIALNQFTDSYNQLVAKQVLDSAGGSRPELVSASMIRRFIHGWLQWGGDTLPGYWNELGIVIIPASGLSLLEHHKSGFIRNMALFPHATNYYGWDGLLAVLQLATGIAINLLQVRRRQGSPIHIVSEVFDISALEHATGDLFSKLREKDPSLVKLPNDALLPGNQPGLYLVHSGGDHYYSALTKAPAEIPDMTCPPVNDGQDQQAGVEDKVPAEHNAPGGESKPAEDRVFSVAQNIPEEPAAGDREGEPVAVAKQPQLWILNWSPDGTPSVLGCTDENFAGDGHKDARLVDPERDDELLNVILREFPGITDWHPAIKSYRAKRGQPEEPGNSSDSGDASGSVALKDGSSSEAGKFREEAAENPDNSETSRGHIADASVVTPASAGESKNISAGSDSNRKVLPLLAYHPMKSFEDGLIINVTEVPSRNSRHKTIGKRQANQQAFKECFASLLEMCTNSFSEYHDFFSKEFYKAFESDRNKTDRYYNQGMGTALYNQAIGIMDEALCIAISLINISNDYKRRDFYDPSGFPRLFKKHVLPKYNDTLSNLLNFSNVFRYIIQSDRSVKFDVRFLQLQVLFTHLLEEKDLDFEIKSQDLGTYICTLLTLFQQDHYSFPDNEGEQKICRGIVCLMYFVAKVIKGYSLERSESFTAERSSSILLSALERHRQKVKNIRELIINLEVLLLLAGGNSLSPHEDQIVFGIKQKKSNSKGNAEANVKSKKIKHKKKQPLVKKDKADDNPVKESAGNVSGINKGWVDGRKVIDYITRVCDDLFTSPMDLDIDDSERLAYLKEVDGLLSSNQDYFPGLKEVLAKFKSRCDAFKRSLHEAAKKQQEYLRIEIERKRKSEAEQRQSKKHKKLARSATGRRKSPGGQAAVKIGGATNNTPDHSVSSANDDPGRQVACLSETEAVLMKAEAKIQSAMELIRQSEQPESLPEKETKKKSAKKEYLKAIKILDDFLERKDSAQATSGKGHAAVDYDIALVLLTVSSWRIDYEYQFTDFFDHMYQTFDTASAWDNLFTIGMRQAVLPAYPKHKHLIELTGKFKNIVSHLSDGEHCNIARALNEQNRALAILQSHYATRGGSEQLPYFDDQMDYLKKNQAFFDAIKTEYTRAKRNVLSAIVSRRLIKRYLLPPGYYRNQGGKGEKPKYRPSELIGMLKGYDVKLENKFANEVEVRRKRLTSLRQG